MQRDWLAGLPIAIAFSILSNSRTSNGASSAMGTAFLIGSLIGAYACIKPQLALAGIPIVWGLELVNHRAHMQPRSEAMREFALRRALPAMLGIAAPLTAVAAWLAYRGSFASFASMVHDYSALHIQQDRRSSVSAQGRKITLCSGKRSPTEWLLAHDARRFVRIVLIDRQFAQQATNRTLFRSLSPCWRSTRSSQCFRTVLEYHFRSVSILVDCGPLLLVLPVLSTSRYVAIPALILTSCVAFSFWRHHVIKARPGRTRARRGHGQRNRKQRTGRCSGATYRLDDGAVQALLANGTSRLGTRSCTTIISIITYSRRYPEVAD